MKKCQKKNYKTTHILERYEKVKYFERIIIIIFKTTPIYIISCFGIILIHTSTNLTKFIKKYGKILNIKQIYHKNIFNNGFNKTNLILLMSLYFFYKLNQT